MSKHLLLKVKFVKYNYLIFKVLLEYIYKDKVDLTVDIAIELLELADKYLLTRLKNLCEQYLA